MALHIHRAGRTDLLAHGLATLLATPQDDPFAPELVLVSARGLERWLSQQLSQVLGRGSGADGVCAGVTFRSPASLIAEITGTAEHDPWSADMLVWPLLEAVDASVGEPWCTTLAAHLGHFSTGDEAELRSGRRYSVARRIAGLFASYARQRPAMLTEWLDGVPGDGAGGRLDDDLAWQPHLWRAVVQRVGQMTPHSRQAQTLTRLREAPTALPPRLSLFGYTRLAATDTELLAALATHHELHLWLPHPSPDLWRRLSAQHGAVARHTDTGHRAVGQPLLGTLGRDLRELQRALPRPDSDDQLGAAGHPDTLLGWLQSDIEANCVRPQGRRLHAQDRSVQVHSCHGAARQVDVLREVLLGLLADDPTLEPRDILVMCPDIETYAPLIAADFGLGDVLAGSHPAHQLRVRLADRSLVQTNPLLSVAAALLTLAGGRGTAGEVLDLAHTPVVRARFAFTDDDLDDISAWVREANIRWGFDQRHRLPFGVDFVHNTWRFGLDRILAGVALSDDAHAWIGPTLPLDDVGSNRVELAGRLAEFVTRLELAVDALSGTRSLAQWLTALAGAVADLTRVGDADAWQAGQLRREFTDVLVGAGARVDVALRLPDVRALLERRLAGRPSRANFRTGTLTVCTMVPMRSVPHRVVCLVGLDDGVFPRTGVVDGDDALARTPMTGERDIRSEDRQLLLDAICAAGEKLVITYTGANEYSGHARPPCVPLAEIIDALDATTDHHESPRPSERVVMHHPLQPFDIRNVTRGGVVAGAYFSFDATVAQAARTAAGQRCAQPEFISGPLPPPPAGDVALADLVRFFGDPVKGFYRALDFTLPWDVDGVEDAMPVEIDKLQEWTVGDRMLADMLRGMSPADARQAEWRRGTLPPGHIGWRAAGRICELAARLAAEALHRRGGQRRALDVDIDLGHSRRLTGTVAPVYSNQLVTVTYSNLDGKHLLESWILLLALAAHDPAGAWSATCIGRRRRSDQPLVRLLEQPRDDPVGELRTLVELYDAGRREPLPLPVKTSYAWAAARHEGGDPIRQAGYRWKSDRFPGEDAEPAHERTWGRNARLDALLQPLRPGEEYDGETHRLGAYSARLWLPMLRSLRNAGEGS